MKTAKSKQKSREVLTTMGNKQPFRKSTLSQTYQPNKGKGQNTKLLLTKSGSQQTGRRGQQSGYRPQFTNEVKMCTMINKVNNISLRYPQGFKMERVHPLVKALFPIYSVPVGPLAGRLSLFYSNWTKLTQDPNILNIMQGFEIPFLEKPYQAKLPNPPVLNHEQSSLVREEAKEMLLKGAIQKVTQCRNP